MKVIFLDRDGVINKYPGHKRYVTKLKEFRFLPRSLLAIKKLSQAGFNIFIISNQAGIAKGIYTKNKLRRITSYMLKKIRASGGKIKGVFYCMHAQEDNCSCRKPKMGLIKKALDVLGLKKLNKKNTYFVGDSMLDIAAGKKAVSRTILVLCGRENLQNKKTWKFKPNYIAKDLFDASKIILNENFNYLCLGRSRSQALR